MWIKSFSEYFKNILNIPQKFNLSVPHSWWSIFAAVTNDSQRKISRQKWVEYLKSKLHA